MSRRRRSPLTPTSRYRARAHRSPLLGIEEIRRGKARLRLVPGESGDTWQVVADRWHVGFTDLGGGAGLALPQRIGAPILKAWNVKEELMDLLALHGTHPDRT